MKLKEGVKERLKTYISNCPRCREKTKQIVYSKNKKGQIKIQCLKCRRIKDKYYSEKELLHIRRKFYCRKCKKYFNTKTFFGTENFQTWCIWCGYLTSEAKKRLDLKAKGFCKVCNKKLSRNQIKFCSEKCRHSYYRKLSKNRYPPPIYIEEI